MWGEERRGEKRRGEKRREEVSTQGWRAWSLSMMCLYHGGNRAQPCVNLLLPSTETRAVPIAGVALSPSPVCVFGLGRCVFGTWGDEKQSVFIREEPFVRWCGEQSIFRGTAQAPRGTPSSSSSSSSSSLFSHQTPYTPHFKYYQLQHRRESRKKRGADSGGRGWKTTWAERRRRRRRGGDGEGAVKGESKSKGDSTESVKGEKEKERFEGSVSSGGVILETNQWLIHSWGLVGLELFLLGCLLAGSCPEECTGACLWKAEATTSSSLTAAQSGNCFELEEKGDGAGM